MKRAVRLIALAGFTVSGLMLPAVAKAAAIPISIYAAPSKTYQNTANNPCVFYGPGNCPADPSGWPDPEGPTNGAVTTTLVQTYSGSDLTAFNSIVGSAFVFGLDINDTNDPETLNPFTLTFYNGATVLLDYSLSPIAVPSSANGSGYADYVLAAGCLGTTTNLPGIDSCSGYQPFVTPAGTTSIVVTFGFSGTGNDGPDKVFAIPAAANQPLAETDPAIPEPATVVLLATGLAAVAVRRFRSKAA
ncbi:MAG: PEP-CTERM sorting domain-containing protein [Vicinamibacterales bacterium]